MECFRKDTVARCLADLPTHKYTSENETSEWAFWDEISGKNESDISKDHNKHGHIYAFYKAMLHKIRRKLLTT
jgi:hypothetical protein